MKESTRILTAAMVLVLIAAEPARVVDAAKKRPFAVKVTGTGRPMILIPGLACSGDVWTETVEHFKSKYECHVLTLAGFAGEPPVAEPFLETVRQGVADYIRERKLEKPVIVGHSLGGFLVFALGASEPDLVGQLIAVDGLPCLPAALNDKIDAEGLKKQSDLMRARLGGLARGPFLAQSKSMLKFWISDPKKREAAEKWGEDSDQATVVRAMAEMCSTDVRPRLSRIKTPVLLIGAWSKDTEALGLKRDKAAKTYSDQVSGIPQHKVVMAENAKHFIMFDAPEWLFAQIDEFLAER
jgi:pimeloyl-ACP methyl ester carboxylesterase